VRYFDICEMTCLPSQTITERRRRCNTTVLEHCHVGGNYNSNFDNDLLVIGSAIGRVLWGSTVYRGTGVGIEGWERLCKTCILLAEAYCNFCNKPFIGFINDETNKSFLELAGILPSNHVVGIADLAICHTFSARCAPMDLVPHSCVSGQRQESGGSGGHP